MRICRSGPTAHSQCPPAKGALSALQVVNVWERGEGQYGLERALTILSVAYPERSRQELASLSIGQRDTLLLELRQQIFADTLGGFAKCEKCAARVEYSLRTREIMAAAGEIDFSRLEIARLDNDPNAPENGKIEFFMEGGL